MTPFDTRLLLVRHGRPEAPDDRKRFLGRSDWPLSEEGRLQAKELGVRLESVNWVGGFVSPLKRARQTAALALKGKLPSVAVLPALAEIDLGDWDGRPRDELRAAYPGLFAVRERDLYGFTAPGGESFRDLARRCVPAIRQILGTPGCWVVVAHAGVFRVVLHELLGIPFAETFRSDPGYGQSLDLGRLGDSVFFDGKEYPLLNDESRRRS